MGSHTSVVTAELIACDRSDDAIGPFSKEAAPLETVWWTTSFGFAVRKIDTLVGSVVFSVTSGHECRISV